MSTSKLSKVAVALIIGVLTLYSKAFTDSYLYMTIPAITFLSVYTACRLALIDHDDVVKKRSDVIPAESKEARMATKVLRKLT